jgi:hypothetical protein
VLPWHLHRQCGARRWGERTLCAGPRTHLAELHQLGFALVLDQRAALQVAAGLVRHLHAWTRTAGVCEAARRVAGQWQVRLQTLCRAQRPRCKPQHESTHCVGTHASVKRAPGGGWNATSHGPRCKQENTATANCLRCTAWPLPRADAQRMAPAARRRSAHGPRRTPTRSAWPPPTLNAWPPQARGHAAHGPRTHAATQRMAPAARGHAAHGPRPTPTLNAWPPHARGHAAHGPRRTRPRSAWPPPHAATQRMAPTARGHAAHGPRRTRPRSAWPPPHAATQRMAPTAR